MNMTILKPPSMRLIRNELFMLFETRPTRKDGSRKRLSPLWIMPEYRGKGYAQAAISAAEQIHGSRHWSLDTILQEPGNLHLYEKMGYRRTGQIERINDRMDIVFYEKD